MTIKQALRIYPDAIQVTGKLIPGKTGILDILGIKSFLYGKEEAKLIFRCESQKSFRVIFSHQAALKELKDKEVNHVS